MRTSITVRDFRPIDPPSEEISMKSIEFTARCLKETDNSHRIALIKKAIAAAKQLGMKDRLDKQLADDYGWSRDSI